jgi:NADH-quinone oxidoreductase subunit A
MSYLSIYVLTGALGGEAAPGYWDYVSIGLYTVMVFALLGVIMFLAGWLGKRRPNPEKDSPYESGIIPAGSARLKFPVQFYLVAIFFIIFDLEAVFIYSWAVAFDLLGWPGFWYILFFIAALAAGLAYIWKKKGLEWGPRS